MNRRGDWIQIFLILFFAFLLLITFVLLFIEKDHLSPEREELPLDLAEHKMHAVMITTLRQPIEGVDINEDGSPDAVSVADALVVGADISDELRKRLYPVPFRMEVTYPDRTVEYRNLEDNIFHNLPETSVLLPGNVQVVFQFADKEVLRAWMREGTPTTTERNIEYFYEKVQR